MPRPRAQSTDAIVERALLRFWFNGYFETSIDVLVRSAGVSRHRLYADFGGKEGLFAACLATYSNTIVTPAFEQVERKGANLADVAAYYETQISRGEEMGLPGPGCLMANTQTEVAPHHKGIGALVAGHNARLHSGFVNALGNQASEWCAGLQNQELAELSTMLVIFTNGLWSFSRTVSSGLVLRGAVAEFLNLIEKRIAP